MELIFGTSIKLLSLSPGSNYNWAKSRDVFELDGPLPRLFKEAKQEDLDNWREDRDNAIDDLTYNELKDALKATRVQTNFNQKSISDVSHKVFLIRRQDLDETRKMSNKATISVITPNVQKKLARRVAQMEINEVVHLYSITCVTPITRNVAGVFF